MNERGSRFGRLVKASLAGLLQPADDPRLTDQRPAIRQQEALLRIRRTLDALEERRGRLETQMAANRAEASARESEAMCAVRQGKDDVARNALRRRKDVIEANRQLENDLAEISSDDARLREAGRAIVGHLESLRTREALIEANLAAAQARADARETLVGLDTAPGQMDEVARIERETEVLNARADAIDHLLQTSVFGYERVQSDNDHRELRDPKIEHELDELKLAIAQEERTA